MRKETPLRILIFSFSFFISFLINEINLSQAQEYPLHTNAKSTENNYSIWSIDNEYYLTPVHNYLNGKGWKRSPGKSNGDYFRRVPGYSLLYFLFIKLDTHAGVRYLIIFQIVLLSLSSVLMYEIMKIFRIPKPMVFSIILLYASLPNFYAYSYFTITEALTPSLVVISFYLLLKYNITHRNFFLLASSTVLAFNVYTRPIVIILYLLYIPCLFDIRFKNLFSKVTLAKSLIIMLPLLSFAALWGSRNYVLTREVVLLEKRNHPQSLDHYKPSFEALCMLYYSWGFDSNDMNSIYFPFMHSCLNNINIDNASQNLVDAIPYFLKDEIIEDVKRALDSHAQLLQKQIHYYKDSISLPNQYDPLEIEICKNYELIEKKVRNNHPFQYYIMAPLKRLASIVFHSNTSSLLIFDKENLNKFTFGLKAINKVFHVLCYMISFLGFIVTILDYIKNKRIDSHIYMIGLIEFIILFFFIFIFKATEQRYMLPFLPLIIIYDVYIINYIYMEYFKISIKRMA